MHRKTNCAAACSAVPPKPRDSVAPNTTTRDPSPLDRRLTTQRHQHTSLQIGNIRSSSVQAVTCFRAQNHSPKVTSPAHYLMQIFWNFFINLVLYGSFGSSLEPAVAESNDHQSCADCRSLVFIYSMSCVLIICSKSIVAVE